MLVSVRDKISKKELTRYAADSIMDIQGFPMDVFDHIEIQEEEQISVDNPEDWCITVGAYFDRFGASKHAILASNDSNIQAAIKDASVRDFIDLKKRREENPNVLFVSFSLRKRKYPHEI